MSIDLYQRRPETAKNPLQLPGRRLLANRQNTIY